MKIGLCGAGGTGKGTLATALSQELKIPMISSSVEWVGKTLNPSSDNYSKITDEARVVFQVTSVMVQAQSERLYESFVTERTILDYLAYAYQFMPGYYQDYDDLVMRLLTQNPYDVVFYLPIEFEPKDESSWKERSDTRKETDRFLYNLLFETNLSVTAEELHGTVEERVKQAKDYLMKRGMLS